MHYKFEGRLTVRDQKRYIPHTFDVPAGSDRMEIVFEFEPASGFDLPHMLTLTLFDPQGFRGAGHRDGASHHVILGATSATPGYLPGPMPEGRWIVEIDAHRISPGEPVHYRLAVTLTKDAEAPHLNDDELPGAAPRPTVVRDDAGWYRGDLHTHTHHSDAEALTVPDLIGVAQALGLDFFFLTDHNTTAGLYELDRLAMAPGELLVGEGMELTTFWGHALYLGTQRWMDWRVGPNDRSNMARLAAVSHAGDTAFIIAHPQSVGDPACTGCTWRFSDMMPGNARMVEVWNGPWSGDSGNEEALALWYDWLNLGLHLIATAGTDVHGIPGGDVDAAMADVADGGRPGFSVIYAAALSQAALLKALHAGHLYLVGAPVSTSKPWPRLTFEAQDGRGRSWMVGDTVDADVDHVTLVLDWAGLGAGDYVRVMVNGGLFDQWEAREEGRTTWSMAPEDADWVVVEIRDAADRMVAVTNPIFFFHYTERRGAAGS
jgi:hypothetical protein